MRGPLPAKLENALIIGLLVADAAANIICATLALLLASVVLPLVGLVGHLVQQGGLLKLALLRLQVDASCDLRLHSVLPATFLLALRH